MALKTAKIPSGYSSVTFSIPNQTGTSAFASAVIQSMKLDSGPEFITTIGNDGLVCAVQPLMAASNGTGGTNHDAETLTIDVLPGNLTTSWPAEGATVVLDGMTSPYNRLNGSWLVTSVSLGATQKANGTMSFKLQRWANVAL